MSISLPTVNLTGLAVGATGNVTFPAIAAVARPGHPQEVPHLQIFNDSGHGLQVTTKVGGSKFSLPAGAWRTIAIKPNETEIDFVVVYVLPSPPVDLLLVDLYLQGETPPDSGTLGNSPVGIGGTVATSSSSTLSNEGNATNTLVIDAGPTTPGQVLSIFNDHFVWSVVQTAVAHQVLKGNTAGTPLQIGQAGDITEILGSLQLDGPLTQSAGSVAGTLTFATPIWGPALKILTITTSTNFNSVTAVTFIFPSAISAGFFYMGNQSTSTAVFKNGATSLAVDMTTGLATAGAAGTHSNGNTIRSDALGQYDNTTNADRITFTPGGAINNGIFAFIGI